MLANQQSGGSGGTGSGGSSTGAGGGNADYSALIDIMLKQAGQSGQDGQNAAMMPILGMLLKSAMANQDGNQGAAQPDGGQEKQADSTPKYSPPSLYPKKPYGLEPVAGIADKQIIYLLNRYFSQAD